MRRLKLGIISLLCLSFIEANITTLMAVASRYVYIYRMSMIQIKLIRQFILHMVVGEMMLSG